MLQNNTIAPLKKFLSQKLKGGALYISILVSILIGIVLTLFILIANYNQRNVTVSGQSSQLFYNLKSAVQMAQSSYFSKEQNFTWIKNEVNDDSVRIKKINWGAYFILSCETKNRHRYLTQSGLYGTHMSADTGLLIADNTRPVGLSGNIVLKANCYLPKAGIKPAYIEGQSYLSSSQNTGFIKNAPYQAPMANEEIIKGLKQQLSLNIYLDSAVSMLPENYSQPFHQKTIAWETSSTRLQSVNLKNNIKVLCSEIEIDSSAHLENILVVGQKVRFKKGFKGKVHVIATDSISMEEGCEFTYPSSFVLLAEENAATGLRYIQFNKRCVFYGGIVALSENSGSINAQSVFIKFHPECEINGFVYSSNYVHIQGILNATVIANKLLLKTPSAVYENHILGCEINPKKHSEILAIPSLFKQGEKLICCESIN